MPIVRINQRILWRSYKIEGRWYEGTVMLIIRKKRYEELHIKTELPGIHEIVIRPNNDEDIKIIKHKNSK